MKKTVIIFLTFITALITPPAFAINRVLSLDGDGDYVEIADSEALNDIGFQVTMEAWIKPTSFPNQWIAIIFKGDERTPNHSNRSFALWLSSFGVIGLNSAPSNQGAISLSSPSGLIKLNQWYHVAGSIDAKNGVMRIFINGAEVANRDFPKKEFHVSKLPLRIGWTHEEKEVSHGVFAGQIDEVRIWNIARTQEEIKRTMHTTLSGKEPGLVGYWGFEDAGNIAVDSSPNRSDGKLIGDAHLLEAELPSSSELDIPTVISGIVKDDSGKPVSDVWWVRLEKDGEEIVNAGTDESGKYRIAVSAPINGLYDLSARKEDMGNWQLWIPLRRGESKKVNLTLTPAVSIEGTILMLDGKTPHVSVLVQAIQDAKAIESTYTDEGGKYRLVNLKPGKYKVRCYLPGEYVYYKSNGRKGQEIEAEILQVTAEKTVSNIDFRLPAFKKGKWKHFENSDGLASMAIGTIYQDYDGSLWFGTGSWNFRGNGVSHFDGKIFTNFTTEDGLGDNSVPAIYRDPDGVMWFGTGWWPSKGGGISKYDGKTFVNLTTADGLAHNSVYSIYQDRDGAMWFGTYGGGVSRYDGDKFVNFTTKDGLAGNIVYTIYGEPDGVLWFGTNGGVSRYDGNGFPTLEKGSKGGFVNFTTEDGLAHNIVTAIHRTPDGMMWFGTGTPWDWGGGASRYDGNQFQNFTYKDGLLSNSVIDIYSDANGVMWFGTVLGVSRYDGKGLVAFTTKDGLPYNSVEAIHQGPDGTFWFGTGLGGVSQYNEEAFVTFNTEDGLMDDFVQDSHRDTDGFLWVAIRTGVSRYDGREFKNFTYKDGLVPDPVSVIHQADDGNLWFGTGGFFVAGGGVSRYDGNQFVNFTTKEGLPSNRIRDIHSEDNGTIWIATNGGVSRYDKKKFKNFTTEDGLAHNWVHSIHSDSDGTMWFGTWDEGISQYDGVDFVNLTTEDGLAHNAVWDIYRDSDGIMWLGTDVGISRYDGEQFVNFTQKDGLAGNQVWAIHQDENEILWFGTYGGGVSGYDGKAWTTLDTQYGLAGNRVFSIDPDPDGSIWFSTAKGLTRYRRSKDSPGIQIVSVKIADEEHTELQSIPAVITGHRVTFKYNAIDFKTLPERRQYRCRIIEIPPNPPFSKGGTRGIAPDWNKPTKSNLFDFTFKKPGSYIFEVQAIDRDLNYSAPASLPLTVIPPFYLRAGFLIPTIGMGTLLLLISIILAIGYLKRQREVQAYQQLAVEELQDARQVQMGLMPDTAPPIEGVEIAGKCLSANDVSGDFYDYLEGKGNNEVALVVADVTGKAMKGAMNAVMTDGILRATAKEQEQFTPASLMMTLNDVLKSSMEYGMNVTMVIAMINRNRVFPKNHVLEQSEGSVSGWETTLTLANAAHHAYPLLLRDGEVQTLKTGGLPLGMRAGIQYTEEQFQLQSGDVLILMTDGIIEAQDSEGRMYSEVGRLAEIIRIFTPDLSAEAMVDAILNDAVNFGGDQNQRDDDMTVVVTKIL